MNDTSPQVVLVDDHLALRKGIELLLRAEGMRVIGVTASIDEARHMILTRKPDVAVLDIGLEGGSGLDLATELLAGQLDTGILLYTGLADQQQLRRGLDSGASGFALKAGSPTELVTAIRAVAEGGEYVDPRLARLLDPREGSEAMAQLSPREREVLDLLADGLTGEEVAEKLFLSPQTVQTHVRNLMRKLGARTRVHALALALRHREIDLA
jgi:DNA-binding NarL/FixJ family response regulator